MSPKDTIFEGFFAVVFFWGGSVNKHWVSGFFCFAEKTVVKVDTGDLFILQWMQQIRTNQKHNDGCMSKVEHESSTWKSQHYLRIQMIDF